MILQDIYTIWLREMIRFIRARSRVISSIALPFFWLIFIGIGFGSSFKLPNVDYVNFLAPGIVGMILLFTSMFSGLSIIWDRQFGFLKEIFVAPVSRTSIMLGKTFGGATVALFNGLIIITIATAIGFLKPTLGILEAVIFMCMVSIFFVSLGLLIASRMKSMEGFQAIMSFLIMPTFFLSGALFPLQNTPIWMQGISKFDPLTYGIDGLRSALIGESILPAWIDFAALFVFSTVVVLLGSYVFRKSNA